MIKFLLTILLLNMLVAEDPLDSADVISVQSDDERITALNELEAQEKQEIRDKQINESYMDRLQKRYIPRMPYLMLPTIIVSVIKQHQVKAYLTLMIEIKGRDTESYRKLIKDAALIKDIIFSDLFDAMNLLWQGPQPPSVEMISGRIKKCLKNHFKDDLAKKIIIHLLNFDPVIGVR